MYETVSYPTHGGTYRRRSSIGSAGLRILIAFHALQSPHSTTRRARGGVIVAPRMDGWSAQRVQFDGEAGAQASTPSVGRARQDTTACCSSSFSSPSQIAPIHAQTLGALALPAVEDAWGSVDADRHLVLLRLQGLGWQWGLWLIQCPQSVRWGAGVVVVMQRRGSWTFRKGRRHFPRAAKIGKTGGQSAWWRLREQRDKTRQDKAEEKADVLFPLVTTCDLARRGVSWFQLAAIASSTRPTRARPPALLLLVSPIHPKRSSYFGSCKPRQTLTLVARVL